MQEDRAAEEGEFRLPLSSENIALGRLGRIYKALDKKTGRVLAVECVDVIDNEDGPDEGGCSSEIVHRILQTELGSCKDAINSENGRHVFCYDSVSYKRGKVYLCSSSSVTRSLTTLQQDFRRLHPLAVKQYIFQIIQGLRVLHKISLSSVLLCGGDIVKIAAWFPSVQTVKTLQGQNILTDPQVHRMSFDSHEMAQDVRSVAYVMVEMLTGLRVRGSLMEKCNLLAKVAIDSQEYQILRNLLDLKSLSEVLSHPYFSTIDTFTSNSLSEVSQEQRHIIGVLTKQDLNKCQVLKQEYLHQIRAWQAQFVRKYQRKPKPADRPAGIIRLQGRCQALNERMQEINNRLATIHGSIYRMITDKESLAIDASSQPASDSNLETNIPDATSSPVGSESSRLDTSGREGNRSPAQKAFMNKFA